MTTEQAIKLLHRLQDEQFDGIHGDERREALEMAVRALEQNLVKESDGLVNDLVKDCIGRQAVAKWLERWDGYVDKDIIERMKLRVIDIPSAHPTYTDEEIQRMQDLESAEIEKAYQLGYEEGKKDAQPTQTNADSTQTNALDCVSRQEAIDALRYAQHRFIVADKAGGMGTVKWSEDVIYFAAAERVLNDLPPAQPHWIPCSERLPHGSCSDLVNVSIHDDSGDTPYDYTSCGWITTDGEYWIVDNEINNHVVAWMPLPKPYGGESE